MSAARGGIVIGVGNPMRGDDAVGLHVARDLRQRTGQGAHEYEGEGDGLVALWEGADAVIIVDAVRSEARPGAVLCFDASTEPLRVDMRLGTGHAVGLAEAIELGRVLGRLPPRVLVYGVVGERFDLGQGLSPSVQAAVPRAVAEITAEMAGWSEVP